MTVAWLKSTRPRVPAWAYSRAELLGLTVSDIVASNTPVDPVQWKFRVDQIRRQAGGMRAEGNEAKVLCITGHAGRDRPEGRTAS